MSEQQQRGGDAATRKREERKAFRAYVWGIALALVLTLVPFALVLFAPGHAPALTGLPRLSVIGAFALLQIVVHLRFFLHIGFQRHREDLQLILFSTLLLVIMVAGTLWIMASLAVRMALPASSWVEGAGLQPPLAVTGGSNWPVLTVQRLDTSRGPSSQC